MCECRLAQSQTGLVVQYRHSWTTLLTRSPATSAGAATISAPLALKWMLAYDSVRRKSGTRRLAGLSRHARLCHPRVPVRTDERLCSLRAAGSIASHDSRANRY